MKSAVFCYAAADAEFAHRIGALLEANCLVTADYRQGLTQPDFDLIDALGLGISADIAVVLLSPDSASTKWKLERWEPLLESEAPQLGTKVAIVLLRECHFPSRLRRRHDFFDLTADAEARMRALKRWVLRGEFDREPAVDLPCLPPSEPPDAALLDQLERELADRPGIRTDVPPPAALAFAHRNQGDFEGVFWIPCAGRSRAGMLGDTAHALGLRLSGNVEQNRRELGRFCATRRCLLVMDGLTSPPPDLFDPGRMSVLATRRHDEVERPDAATILALFGSWTRNVDSCLSALGDAHAVFARLLPSDAALKLGAAIVAVLRYEERLAEAFEVLEAMEAVLRERGDTMATYEITWEKSWILEHWGEPIVHPVRPAEGQPRQLSLGL